MEIQRTSEDGRIPPKSIAHALDKFNKIYLEVEAENFKNQSKLPAETQIPVGQDDVFFPRQKQNSQ